ncbi:MAG: response regulator [Nitrospinae bacterium]|nr:response regulator [Nitrospinota bacterium]
MKRKRDKEKEAGKAVPASKPASAQETAGQDGASFPIVGIGASAGGEKALLAVGDLKLIEALALGRMGHWEYDPATNRTEWSSTMYEIFARDPLRGPPSSKEEEGYFTPEQWGKLRGHMARALAEGTVFSYDFDATVPGRGVVFLTGTITSFEQPDSGVKKLFGVVQDITERKRMEEALRTGEQRLSFSAHAGKLGVWELNVATGMVWSSLRCNRIFGYETALPEWTYETFLNHALPEDRPLVDEKFKEALSTCEDWDYEYRIQRKDGTMRWVKAHGRTECNERNEPVVLFGLVEDITERKAAEEKLKAAKEEAEAAMRLEEKFVSLVAHDLKSPLGHNILALKNLRSRLKDEGSAFADDPALTLVINSNENMLQTVRGLLDLSRIKSGAICPRPAFVDARHLVQYAIDMETGPAARKQIIVLNAVPPHTRLYCDMKLTHEVLANLISNAIKFSKKGDSITIGKGAGEPASLFVADTGTGIAPDHLAMLFKYDASKSTNGTEGEIGTGLGLPLCNELMKGQGGSLRIESAPGNGTTAVISFPHAVPKALVVENADADMGLARMLLKSIGIEVIDAAGGEEALRLMEKELPHLVLIDVNLPDIGGLEVLRRKSDNPNIAMIPAIVITGNIDADIAEGAFRLGASDFIKKTLQAEALVARVRRIVS